MLDDAGAPLPGVYCAGWIKRGPTGVIGTNKKDATETVELLLEDAEAGRLPGRDATAGSLEDVLAERGVEPVLYSGWEAIDLAEREAGEPLGRPRVKLRTWDELLAAAARTARPAVSAAKRTPQGLPGRPLSGHFLRLTASLVRVTRDCSRGPTFIGMSRCVECLSCGLQRLVAIDEGECPRCGYLGWARPGRHRGPPSPAARRSGPGAPADPPQQTPILAVSSDDVSQECPRRAGERGERRHRDLPVPVEAGVHEPRGVRGCRSAGRSPPPGCARRATSGRTSAATRSASPIGPSSARISR